MSHIGNMRYKSSEAWSFGSGPRNRNNLNQRVPGPGTYTIGKDIRDPRSNIPIGTARRTGLQNPNNNPGPGTYRESQQIGIAPAYSMVPRRPPGAVGRAGTPGPGTYAHDNKTLPDNPKYTFGLKTDQHRTTVTRGGNPGPGTYAHKDDLHREGVGPKFGTGKRSALSQTLTNPGPGQYKHLEKTGEGPRYGFGSSGRMGRPQTAMAHAPGPGQYTIRSSLDNDKGISMTARRPDSAALAKSRTPGPGAYTARTNPKEQSPPRFSFGTSQRRPLNNARQTPGPGIYNAEKLRTSAGIWGFGTGGRQPLSRPTTAPGPGTYNYARDARGPAYSLVPRRDDLKGSMANPGPGTYTYKVDAYRTKEPIWGMGTSSRKPLSQAQAVPGPGAYKHQGGLAGPQWGFGSSIRMTGKKPGDGTGPGHYKIPSTVAVVPRYNMPHFTARD